MSNADEDNSDLLGTVPIVPGFVPRPPGEVTIAELVPNGDGGGIIVGGGVPTLVEAGGAGTAGNVVSTVGEFSTAGGTLDMPVGVFEMPVGVFDMPVGVVDMPVGVEDIPVGVVDMPVGVVDIPVGVVEMPVGVVAMPVGVVAMPVGVVDVPVGAVAARCAIAGPATSTPPIAATSIDVRKDSLQNDTMRSLLSSGTDKISVPSSTDNRSLRPVPEKPPD